MEDTSTPTIEQPTAETAGQATPTPATPAVAAPSERKELASFDDALRNAARTDTTAAKTRDSASPKPAASGGDGGSADPASKPDPAARPAAPDPTTSDQPAAGGSADSASKPDDADTEEPTKAADDGTPKSSRRESATVRTLTAERDALQQQVAHLQAAATIPERVTQAMRAVILDDETFNALKARKDRDLVTGDYLTREEEERYVQAFQVREWLAPAYEDAQAQAVESFNTAVRGLKQEQADALAPVLRDRPYISHAPITSAATWQAVYEHIADSSFAAGGAAKAAELQPRLDEANGRNADLENELSGFRHVSSAGRGMPLERGGQPGGAFGARPGYRESSASDLFTAALTDEDRRRARRGAQPAARSA